jgi:hypothetical protein
MLATSGACLVNYLKAAAAAVLNSETPLGLTVQGCVFRYSSGSVNTF